MRCVGIFFGNDPDQTVDHGECECGKADDGQGKELMLGACYVIADDGNDERYGKGDGAVDAACGIEIIDAYVIGKEVGIPCGKTGSEELIDGVCHHDKDDKTNDQQIGILHEHRQKYANASR